MTSISSSLPRASSQAAASAAAADVLRATGSSRIASTGDAHRVELALDEEALIFAADDHRGLE